MVVIHKKPTVTEIFIDKITATLPIKSSDHEAVLGGMHQLVDVGYGLFIRKPFYEYSVILGIGVANTPVLLQCKPYGYLSDWAFFRIEFNPSTLGSEGLAELKLRLDVLLPLGYESLIASGMLTRFDVTFDIQHVSIDQLVFRHPGFRLSKAYYRAGKTDSFVEDVVSLYIGGDSGARQFCFYDKVQQIKDWNSEHPLNQKPVPIIDTTRVEVTNKKRVPFKSLLNVPNQFEKLEIFTFHTVPQDDWQFSLFLIAARHQGLQKTLYMVPKYLRKKYIQRLRKSVLEQYDPIAQWSGWKGSVNALFYPATSHLKVDGVASLQSIALA